MSKEISLGQILREIRGKRSITSVSKEVGIDRTYLSKIEHGHEVPSENVLNKLIAYYSIHPEGANLLFEKAGYLGGLAVKTPIREEIFSADLERKEVIMENKKDTKKNINISGPVLYTDSVYLTESSYGIVLDFAQNLGPTNNQNVVARVGMSKEHAKALLDLLKKNLK